MPWKVTSPMDQRDQLITLWRQGDDSGAALCRRFGVSRKTAYKWLGRFEAEGHDGLCDRSRARHHQPDAVAPETERAILEARAAHPLWGPRKLLAWLRRRDPQRRWPCASTIGEILRRHGLTIARRPRRRASPSPGPLADCVAANQVWCADFKGWFRTGDGRRCDPLTISDAHSRFLLRCQAMATKTGCAQVRPLFEATFREFGLPEVIRTDNGPPFATTGLGGLSALSVWWMRLGIVPERIRPSHPEDNGRHERMHRTLKAATANPPRATLRAQQRAFDRFREEYNFERPHEALGQHPPASCHRCSGRRFPERLPALEYPSSWVVRKVKDSGRIKWGGRAICVCQALTGEHIGLEEVDEGLWRIHFGTLALGHFDERRWRVLRLARTRRTRRS